MNRAWEIAMGLVLAASCACAAAQTEPQPLVDLDARDASAGMAAWKNRGSLGDFNRAGAPAVHGVEGVKAVVFDGKTDAYIGPPAPPAFAGNAPRTVEAWVINPRIDGPAETVVSWGKGGADTQSFSLNIALKYAAVTLAPSGAARAGNSAAALPWGEEHPMEDQWHHLVVTYDGKNYAIYDNGSMRHATACELKTASGGPIVVAALIDAGGKCLFDLPRLGADGKADPKGGTVQVGGSIAVAALRIYSTALTHEQVVKNFNADAGRFGAVSLDALDARRSPWPTELASTFSFGYASDCMPKDNAQFETLLVTVKGLGFNVIHATYTPGRLALCKKHGIKMMVDAISGTDHHVWATPIKWKQAAISLRGNPDVWGYNLWNDPFGDQGGTLRTHVRSLRIWDPTHPAFCGTYQWPAAAAITNGDMPGYYDFHWQRGIAYHLKNCRAYLDAARRNKGMWGTWLSATPGKSGAERVRRSLWSANIAMAFGCKAFLWFLGQDIVDQKTLALKSGADDFRAIHAQIMPLRTHIMKIGLPSAVYSTVMTRDMFDKPWGDKTAAPGVAPFPKEFLVQPLSGEFIAGVFQEQPDSTTLFVANYNAYAGQDVTLKLNGPRAQAALFDRTAGTWAALPVQDGTVSLKLAPGGGELVRVGVDESMRLAAMRQGLVAYYPFDQTFKDATGRNPDALAKGVARISTTDKFMGDGAAALGGAAAVDAGYLVVPAPNALKFDKTFTLAGWCRAYVVRRGSEVMGTLAGKDGRGFVFTMGSNGNWGFQCRTSAGEQVIDQVHYDWAYRKYKVENWCFFAFVVDEAGGARRLICYGNRAGDPELQHTSNALTVSGSLGGGAFYVARTAPASFDEIAIWNRALADDEVAYLFNKGRGFDCHRLLAAPTTQPATEAASRPAAASLPAEAPQIQAFIDQIAATSYPGEAVDLFNRGRVIGKNSIALHQAYMLKMLSLGLPRLAHLGAAELTRLAPANGTAWSVVAYYRLAKEGRYSQAMEPAVQAAALAPNDTAAISNLGALTAVCETMKITSFMTPAAAKLLRDNEAMWKIEPAFSASYDRTIELFKKSAADIQSLAETVAARGKEMESLAGDSKACQTAAAANTEKIAAFRIEARRWSKEYDVVRGRERVEGPSKALEDYRRYVEGKYRGAVATIDALTKQNATLAAKFQEVADKYQTAKTDMDKAKAALARPVAPKFLWQAPCVQGQAVADRENDASLVLTTSAPAAASRGDDSPATKAAAALRIAKMFLQNNRTDQALRNLREITYQYPGTPAAAEARQLLDQHGP